MDKIPCQNEETLSAESQKIETDNAIIVNQATIDVHSLPQKKPASNSNDNTKELSLDEQQLEVFYLPQR